ncbi:PorP/SprF family type IX secretion system membrane protein [Myroides sp. LJL119]
MRIYNKIKLLGICLLFVGSFQNIHAQQDPQYTQYMYNTSQINPGYVASKDVLSIFGVYRTQWVGLQGAPKTTNLALSSPISNNGLALGVNYTNDRLGAMDENTVSLNLGYSINIGYDYHLAFGLKASANMLNVDYSRLHIYDQSDPFTQNNISNKFTPNIGAGLYLYSDKMYLGASVPQFLSTTAYDDNQITTMREKMHFYLMGGYVFDINYNIKLKPAFLLKTVQGAPLQVDLSANVLFNEKFTLGAGYRWDSALSALAGFQVNQNIFIGYSYDFETTKLAHYNSGSHEIFLRFELFNSNKRINTPRFF